jgi:hypothetical protein
VLDNADDFIAALLAQADLFQKDKTWAFLNPQDIYCPVCGGVRKASLTLLFWRKESGQSWVRILEGDQEESRTLIDQLVPVLAGTRCLQCGTLSTLLLFEGPNGYELAIFPKVHGGLATPHTPKPVAYYLDQAKRAQSVGANSAAVAMYRAALELLLFEQGYTERMLGPKLRALESNIAEGTAKPWARDLKAEYLTVVKKLGDAAIHPGDGNVERQSALDNGLLRQLEITFSELLAVVYEREHEEAERLEALKQALAEVEKVDGPSAAA